MRYVIPLTPEPQRFSIVLAGRELCKCPFETSSFESIGEAR